MCFGPSAFQLRSQSDQKSFPKPSINCQKFGQHLDQILNSFLTMLGGFWKGFGRQDGSKIDKKSITKQHRKKTMPKKCGQNSCGKKTRKPGTWAPEENSIAESKDVKRAKEPYGTSETLLPGAQGPGTDNGTNVAVRMLRSGAQAQTGLHAPWTSWD